MATINTIAVPAKNVRSVDVGEYAIDGKPVLPAAANGDRIVLFTAPHGVRLFAGHLRVNAAQTAALKLQRNSGGTYTDITATSTAGTAGVVSATGLIPIDLAPGDTIEVLGTGAGIAAQPIEYDLLCRHA